MLCLTRKRDDRILLFVPPSATETRIELVIRDSSRTQVSFGIEAPIAVRVSRSPKSRNEHYAEYGDPVG